MTRSGLIQRFVLNAIADDCENVDQTIFMDVANLSGRCGLRIERSEIVQALAVLIEGDLARAYLLSSTEPAIELRDMPIIDAVEDEFKTYFYITKKGMEYHSSDRAWWPFDGQDNLRTGWVLDESA